MTRGLAAAATCTLLSICGHAGAGGALPDAGLLLVLALLLAGFLITVADRRRGPIAILFMVGGSQLVLHGLLQMLGTHSHQSPDSGAEPLLMTAAHAVATVVTAAVLAGAESAVFVVASVLSWTLTKVLLRPLSIPPGRPEPLTNPAQVTGPRDARPRGALGRRLCPRRGPPISSAASIY